MTEFVRQSIRPWSVVANENAHTSRTTWYILIQLCIILQEMITLVSTHLIRIKFTFTTGRAHYGKLIVHVSKTLLNFLRNSSLIIANVYQKL